MLLKVATLQDEVTDPVKQPSSVVEISENQIDQVMSMLNEADPTAPESDPPGQYRNWIQEIFVGSNKHLFIYLKVIMFNLHYIELQQLEQQVNGMGPLIDAELELVDRR